MTFNASTPYVDPTPIQRQMTPPPMPQQWAPKTLAPYGAAAHPAYVLRADRNGLGTAGMVLGIIGVALSIIPIVGIAAWFIWPVGAVLSGVGLNRVNLGTASNRGVALAGIVTSGVAALLCFGWLTLTLASGFSWF